MTRRRSLELATYASLEAQAAAIADDIAYNAHDLDDGLRAGLFDLDDLRNVDFVAVLVAEIEARHPGLERPRFIHEIGRRVITRFVEDVIAETRRRLAEARAGERRRRSRRRSARSSPFRPRCRRPTRRQGLPLPRMYRHPRVMRVRSEAADVAARPFCGLRRRPRPDAGGMGARGRAPPRDRPRQARIVCDYIAGMTDRYALAEHRRLFDEAPELR